MLLTRFPTAAAALVLASAFALAACGGGAPAGGSTPVPPPTTWSAASGVAQKGPLARGSTIAMQELGLNLAATGVLHTATTDSDLGTFTPATEFASRYVGVTATGPYQDEVLDAPSDGPVTLQSYADLGVDTTLNANLLTTLAYARIAHLVNQGGLAFPAARAQAETEVLAAFGIATSPAVAPFGALDVADAGASGTATQGDRILAALSAVVVQGRDAAQVGALVAAAQADLAANGAITDPATRQALAASAQALDLSRTTATLNRLYAALGTPVTAPALAEWLDRDGDGVVGHDEFRVDDAAAGASFTLPADFAPAHAGATLAATGGQLWINGTPASPSAVLQSGDVVAVSAPSTLADGVLTAYVLAGSTPVARVAFVKGLASLAVTPASSGLPIGLTQRFVATGTFNDGHSADVTASVTWASSTPATADVDAGTGQADALSAGTTTVTATSGSVSGSTDLTVVAAAIQSIAIAQPALVTGVGITRPLTATATFTDGTTADVTAGATWTSLAPATATVAVGQVTGVALGATTVSASIGAVVTSVAVTVTTDLWTPAAPLPVGRVAGASATLLADGTVLVIGGVGNDASGAVGVSAVDLYDPVTRAWLPAGSRAPLATQRSSHTATLLPDGRILVCGGATLGTSVAQGYVNDASAEIYDPAHDAWTAAAPMHAARSHHTATLLPNGTVLVAGGEDEHYQVGATAEVYDPVTDTWTPTALPMASPRSTHTATLLPNGRVLIVGGFDIELGVLAPLASAELYDPVLGTFTTIASTAFPHSQHTASLLASGRVLVAAGGNATAETFDPATGRWTATGPLQSGRAGQAATLLASGKVLVAGGTVTSPNAERFDPLAGTWSPAAAMSVNRDTPIGIALPDGSALVCGGAPDATSSSCETYW